MSNVVPLKPGGAGGAEAAPGAVRRILMVEDNANDAELLQACLAEALRDGSVILHARTLAEGLALERAHEVQLTLLDLDLPDSTGFRTLERMRASASGPVVVISGNGHPQLVDEALKRRAYDVIPKHELDAATLRRVLRLATLHHEASSALRATEGRLRALVENSAEALVLFDAAGRIEYASASMRRMLGYNPAEVVGRNGVSFVCEEDRAAVRTAFAGLVAAPGSSASMRVRFMHQDGGVRVLESTLVNRLGDGEVAGIVCSFRDLTQEEQARARFDATFENAAVGLAHVDLEGRFLIANRRLADMLGYTPAELVGRSVRGMSHPEDIDATAEQRAQLRAGAIPQFTRRKRYLRKDGTVLWAQLTVSLERDAQGAPLYEIAALEDVSEVVRAEERLRASESRLRAIIDAEPECMKVLDAAGTLLDMNPAGLAMIEADSLAAVAGQCVFGLVAPAHRQAFRELTERACGGERGMLEFEVTGLRGTRRWLETHAVPLRDEADGRKLMLGITRDISERKAAELALRDSEARFRSLTELSSDWYWEQDAEYRFTRFDGGAGDAAWGGDQSKSLGLRRWEIPSLTPLAGTWEEHRALLAARKPFRGVEYMRVTEKGERRYVTTSGEPVYGADGGFVGYRGTAADITERKTAELAVRESEERFRSLTELSSDYYWETDAAHRLSLRGAGGTALAQSTFGPGGGVGKRRWELPFLTPDLDDWMAHKAVMDAQEPFAGFEFSRPTAEGGERFFSITGGPVFDAAGKFTGYRGVGTDITERKLSERRLRLEHEVARVLAAAADAPAGLRGVIRVVCETEGWDCGRYFEVDDKGELLRFREAWGVDDPEVRRFLEATRVLVHRKGEGVRGMVWQSGEPIWVADVRNDPRVTALARASLGEIRGAFVAPVHAGATVVGVLSISSRVMRKPDEPLLKAMGVIGSHLGQFLSRQRAEQATRSSEARFRSLTKMSSDFYWETDAGHRFTQRGAGSRATAVPAFRDGTMFGKTRWELPFLKPDMAGWMAHKAVLDARLPFRDFEFSRAGVDGDEHFIVISGEPVFDAGGNFTGYHGVGSDITERKRAEQAIRDSEERFRNLTGLSSDWYWEQDAEFRFTKLGVDPASPVYGTGTEALGKSRWELPLTPLSCTWAQHRETLRAQRTFRDFEYSYAGADGKPRYISASGYPVRDAGGRFQGYRGIARDITPRMQSEARMRMHAERQAAVARFGQFALGRHTVEELYAEAVRALRCEGVDAVCLLEMYTERREYLVRAAHGEGPHASVGLSGPMAPDSVWPEILRDNAPRIAGREYLAGRPLDRPWRAWLHKMGSAVYAPVRDDEKPIAMLCMYSAQEHAFGADDVRFIEAVSHVLSTALQRQKAEERLARMAQFDALTGLPNRTLLQDRLGQSIVQSRRRQLHAGVLFVDLDRFKLVNDTLGHHLGDVLIRQVGQRLLACVRPGDTVGRISGDEFAVVLADMARPDDAALVGQKILESLAVPFDLGGNEAYVTASVGIAVYPGDGDDAETLLKNADMAMYRAKESSRNSYCFFTAEMNQRSVAKVQLNADLRHALERAEFALHYQPKVDLKDGRLRGLEALLRWNHPTRGVVSPAEFIPALEDSGLIVPVGEWVVEEACRQLHAWAAAGLATVPVAVNLSPKQFRRRDLDLLIRDALTRAGISSEYLELEITESGLMDNAEDAVRVMRNLRAAGLKISIDDFGTGYSSLSYLTKLPLSALKIDGSFVRAAGSSAESSSIVRAIIDMAQNLRLTVIAEGVETEEQAAFLRGLGCDQAQGYLFSRPLPAAGVAAWLAAA